MENLNTSFYKPTKFSPNEKGIENYQTVKKETIYYKRLFPKATLDARLDHKAGSGKIWEERNSGRPLAPKLKKGEFAVVERKYAEVGMFDFTTRDNRINNAADVAFIFRQLESEAVEHAFAVYIDKEKKPFVQWLSMGGINSTIIDPRIMVDAAQRLKAKEIYLIHNHPSGNLKPSAADMNIVAKLKSGFEPMGIIVNAIIINLVSGSYLQFDENGSSVVGEGITSYDSNTEKNIGVFSFNKQAFLQSPINTRIQSPGDAARFLSQQKFSSGEKAGYLLLTTKNEIVGNFFATNYERNKAYKEVAGLVSKFGATSVIAYTNKSDNAAFYRDLRADLKNLEIGLMDVIECESSEFVCQAFEKYKSLMEQGRLYETPSAFQTKKIDNLNVPYELGFGNLGNGTTVWNRLKNENNDYQTIAHISDSGKINFYDKNLPEEVQKQIRNVADRQGAKFDQEQYDKMRFREESEIQPYEKSEEFDYNFPSMPVMVVPLTQQQKSDMAQSPFYVPPHYGFPDLSLEQIASVPDVIEGHHLDYKDKLVLYESELQFKGETASYHIAENNTIVKGQDGMKPFILTHADVVFNNFESTRQDFENIRRRSQGMPDDSTVVKESQTNYIINKTKIMDTQNTLSEEHLNSKGVEVNDKETYQQMNLDYLANQIKYLGFGEGLQESLSKKMSELKETIDMPVTLSFFVPGSPLKKQDVDFSLHLNKGKESNMYFLNSYSAQLKGLPEENNESQRFYINKGKGITAKEAFNLLSDRTINKDFTNKEGVSYNAWVKLKPDEANSEKGNRDFQMYSENYGFDLGKTLSKYPIKEMESPEAAERLVNSLKFISANPQFKNLSVYNHDGSVMFHNNIVFNKSNDIQKQDTDVKPTESPVMKVVKSPGMKR